MGVSFKVSKTCKRFRPMPPLFQTSFDEVSENSNECWRVMHRNEQSTGKFEVGLGEDVGRASTFPNSAEVSFTLNLFSDGYSIEKPSENGTVMLQDVPKNLHPYDRTSQTLFSAIECGRLPGDILDDISCKYVDGALLCEVRDYRKSTSEPGSVTPPIDEYPIVSKISLKMSLENVVKDIPLISDDSWSYRDLMELESGILKALQPQLCLDPTPRLDRLSNVPPSIKLNFSRLSLQMKRPRTPEITVTSSNKSHGKKICIDSMTESSNARLGDSGVICSNKMPQHVQNHGQSSVLALKPINLGNERSIKDRGSQSVSVSRASPAIQDKIISCTDNIDSRTNLHGKRDNMDVPLSPLSTFSKKARPSTLGSDGTPQQQMGSYTDSTLLQQQATTRGVQHNLHVEKDSRKAEHAQKRKPAGSKGALPESHLSSKSSEFCSGSAAAHYGAVVSLGSSQKERAAVTPVTAQSSTSSANNSMQRQHHVQAAAMSGVGSPVSVNNMSVLLYDRSPSVETPSSSLDQTMIERFSLFPMVTMRHQVSCKKNKVNDFLVKKPKTYPAQQLFTCLSNISNNEDFKDDMKPLSKSLVGGSMNILKNRVLTFVQLEHVVQGNIVSVVPKARTRMVMSEKLNGTVSMYYGNLKDEDFVEIDDYPPVIPNNHMADLLADQFSRLMAREGYLVDDHIQQKLTTINPNNSALGMQQAVSGLQSNAVPNCINSGNASSPNLVANTRTLPSGLLTPARPMHVDHHQQQHLQFQRSPMMFATDPLSHFKSQGLNNQFGSQVDNKPSQLQLQQQHQQRRQEHQHQQQYQQQHQYQQQYQQQQQQMHMKMMMGLGTPVAMGNMRNNMNGLGRVGIKNPMSPSQALSMSNTISEQLQMGKMSPAQAAVMQSEVRMVQRGGNILEAPQVGMSGARQMQPGLMLGQTANRATQHHPMGPPNLMVGTNPYLKQYQQQSQQQRQPQQSQWQQSKEQQSHSQHMNQRTPMNPQHINQRTPMSPQQISSGPEVCPPAATPHLSSQILGSVGSITNSPMDTQGANKNSPVSNT